MAGNIQNVNLAILKSEIASYYNITKNLQTSAENLCVHLINIKNFWTGKRINTIINLWNNNYKKIITCIDYFFTINSILNEIYNQYISMEKGTASSSSIKKLNWNGVNKISDTDETTIKFVKETVESEAKWFNESSSKINTSIAKLVNQLDAMQRYSDSLKTLTSNYRTAATELRIILNNLTDTISTELTKAINDVKLTEQYNEADAKRASSTNNLF